MNYPSEWIPKLNAEIERLKQELAETRAKVPIKLSAEAEVAVNTQLRQELAGAIESAKSMCRQLKDAKSEIERLKHEAIESTATIEALEAKVKALAPHATCACSYDKPGDVCNHHSPVVMKLKQELVEITYGRDENAADLEHAVEEIVVLKQELAEAQSKCDLLENKLEASVDYARTAIEADTEILTEIRTTLGLKVGETINVALRCLTASEKRLKEALANCNPYSKMPEGHMECVFCRMGDNGSFRVIGEFDHAEACQWKQAKAALEGKE